MSIPSAQRRGLATRPDLITSRPWVLVGCLVALGLVFFFVGHRLFQANPWLVPPFETPPYDRHVDEYAWYHYTYHHALFFHDGALDFESWGAEVPSIGQPNMVKFFLGTVLEAHGIAINTSREKMRSWWQPFTDDDLFKDYLAHHLPFPNEALLVGRFYSAVFTYLTVVLCVVYVARITNLPTAVLFGLFIGHLPFLQVSRMMADSYSLCFFALSILLFDVVVTWRGRQGTRLVAITAYSLVVGVTMGIKLTGFLALSFLPLFFVFRCLGGCRALNQRRLSGVVRPLFRRILDPYHQYEPTNPPNNDLKRPSEIHPPSMPCTLLARTSHQVSSATKPGEANGLGSWRQRGCLEGVLLSLYHVLLATSLFVFFHPQTHDNPVAGIARFFQHQLPATATGEAGPLARAGSEITYQVGVLLDTTQAMLRFEGFSVVLFGLLVFLLLLGLASLVVRRPAPSTPCRFLPLILVIASFSTVLSHEVDERYTWLLTFVLSMLVFLGGDFLVRCATMWLGGSLAHERGPAGSPSAGEGR